MRRLVRVLPCILVLSGALGACGSDPETAGPSPLPGGGIQFGLEDGGLPACATESKQAEKLPLDMAIGLDTSFSMDFYGKWPAVQAALKAFIRNPAYSDLGLALQFFPIRKQCSVADYKIPAVPMALLPQTVAPVSSALDAQKMSGGTPMVPLLEGITDYLKDLAPSRPKRRPVVVLATDGVPDDTCTGTTTGLTNTLDNAVAVATAAAASNPPVQTFVIGVGSELSSLNAIALAGGTQKAVLVDTSQNVEQAFLKALDSIRKQAIPCSFDIPATSTGTLDATKVNVSYADGKGGTEVFVYTASKDGCTAAPTSGWYFDDANAPKKVVLCDGACEKVKVDDSGKVDIIFGCNRIEALR